jgi:hypothetical protein
MALLWKVASSFTFFLQWLTKGDKLMVCYMKGKKNGKFLASPKGVIISI